jgi:hypothetical protein
MHYIIEMRDTSMRAIGPFASQDAAAEWGANHNPDDDPRWQTIELDVEDGLIVVPIVAPVQRMHAENDPSDCESCDGYGRVWKHADPTTGQSVECEVYNQPVSQGAGRPNKPLRLNNGD